MIHFNVLTEPWIPVVDFDGNQKELGILDTLKQAHEIKEISDTVITNEYGIFRFLCTFLMDAYQPKDSDDLMNLYDAGSFDMQKIQNYIEQCKKEGVSFDLFDRESPFLQAKYKEEFDKKLTSVASLNIAVPSGNNHIHFDHRLENQQSMTYAEAARSLCAVNLFCTAAAQGYPSTINGAPPIYFILEDKNLFGSLAGSMVSKRETENFSYNDPPVFWRSKQEVIPKTQEASTSVLYGMSYPCRRVLLNAEKDGTVKSVYYCQGKNFIAYDSWNDPHVSYSRSEKGRSTLKSSMVKEPWRNITTIITSESTAPIFVQRAIREKLFSQVVVKAYCVATEKASYFDMHKSTLKMPCSIAENETKRNRIQEIIEEVEYMAGELGKRLEQCYGLKGKKGSIHRDIQGVKTEFMHQCKNYVLQDVIATMDKALDHEAAICKEKHLKELKKKCIQSYDNATEKFLITGRQLMDNQKIRTSFIYSLYADRKEEK